MRIIGEQRDYYDFVQSYGVEPDRCWVREPRVVEVGSSDWADREAWGRCVLQDWSVDDRYLIKERMIGFCGRLYPVACIDEIGRASGEGASVFQAQDLSAFRKFAEKHFRKQTIKKLFGRGGKWDWGWKPNVRSMFFPHIRAFYEVMPAKPGYVGIFKNERSPVFVVSASTGGMQAELDTASLGDYQFGQIIEPHTAYQEISMYIASEMPERLTGQKRGEPKMKKISEVPDVLKAESKGFDEWSFRRKPKSG